MKPALLVLVAIAFAVATLRCSGDEDPAGPPTPTPGTFTLFVQSPNGAEGAAVVDIDGSAVTSVTAIAGTVYTEVEGDRLRIVIVRAAPGELSARLAVSDTAADLDPLLQQVADATNALRPSLAGYAVGVRP